MPYGFTGRHGDMRQYAIIFIWPNITSEREYAL